MLRCRIPHPNPIKLQRAGWVSSPPLAFLARIFPHPVPLSAPTKKKSLCQLHGAGFACSTLKLAVFRIILSLCSILFWRYYAFTSFDQKKLPCVCCEEYQLWRRPCFGIGTSFLFLLSDIQCFCSSPAKLYLPEDLSGALCVHPSVRPPWGTMDAEIKDPLVRWEPRAIPKVPSF